MPTTTLGRNLKAARGRSCLSLEGLADLAGVSAWTVGAIERGQVTSPWAPTLAKLAGVLGTTAEKLLSETE